MPTITLPSDKLVEIRIRPTFPNAIRHRGLYSNKTQVHTRGAVFLLGRLSWPRLNESTHEDEIAEIEAFLYAAADPRNTFQVSLPEKMAANISRENAMFCAEQEIIDLPQQGTWHGPWTLDISEAL